MAKIKVKKESTLKLRFTEHSGQEWELWNNFCFDLIEISIPEGAWIDLVHKNQGLVWIHQGTTEERIKKADIIEIAQKHNIEIELEEEEKKEEKWIPIHKILMKLAKKDPVTHLKTLAIACAERGKIPKEEIPKLLKVFKETVLRMLPGLYPRAAVEEAIRNLKEQQKEKE